MKMDSNKYYRMPFIMGPLFDRENPPRFIYPQIESVALKYQTDADAIKALPVRQLSQAVHLRGSSVLRYDLFRRLR